MKLSTVLTTLAVATSCDAFSTGPISRPTTKVALNAANADASHESDKEEAGLMSRRAAATAMLTASLMAAPMVAQADTSLDLSLPSYDTKMSGFGDGTEAYSKGSGDEKEKQRAAMMKAEEARKEALAKKKAEQKEREEEDKRRAAAKKAEAQERLKNIWN